MNQNEQQSLRVDSCVHPLTHRMHMCGVDDDDDWQDFETICVQGYNTV